jgi:UDP-xylose/UDP-N-acetylglucosamine transporter B4
VLALNSDPIFHLGPVAVPSMIFYLACNAASNLICISAVYRLTSECLSLTVTLVVTLKKFLSLLFSIWYFDNPFTLVHWLGTAMVFAGTLLFSDVPGMIRQQREEAVKSSKKTE